MKLIFLYLTLLTTTAFASEEQHLIFVKNDAVSLDMCLALRLDGNKDITHLLVRACRPTQREDKRIPNKEMTVAQLNKGESIYEFMGKTMAKAKARNFAAHQGGVVTLSVIEDALSLIPRYKTISFDIVRNGDRWSVESQKITMSLMICSLKKASVFGNQLPVGANSCSLR